jgi:hypothetical protein
MDEERKSKQRVAHPNFGDVRDRMLASSRLELEHVGRRWSVRAASRASGLSSGAWCRHWETQRDLEDALVEIGFQELAEYILAAEDDIALREVYENWVKANRELYALMFDPNSRVPASTDDPLVMGTIRRFHAHVSIDLVWGAKHGL